MKPKPIRVLIADDEAHVRRIVARIVTALGGKVVAEARDGIEATRLFAAHSPDIVILDINMPSVTGEQVLARIVAMDRAVIPVMMTSQDTIDAVRHCFDLGAREYILKSNPAEEIYRLLRESWPRWVAEIEQKFLEAELVAC